MDLAKELQGRNVTVKVGSNQQGYKGPFIYYEGIYKGIYSIPRIDQKFLVLEKVESKIPNWGNLNKSSKLAAISLENLISIELSEYNQDRKKQ